MLGLVLKASIDCKATLLTAQGGGQLRTHETCWHMHGQLDLQGFGVVLLRGCRKRMNTNECFRQPTQRLSSDKTWKENSDLINDGTDRFLCQEVAWWQIPRFDDGQTGCVSWKNYKTAARSIFFKPFIPNRVTSATYTQEIINAFHISHMFNENVSATVQAKKIFRCHRDTLETHFYRDLSLSYWSLCSIGSRYSHKVFGMFCKSSSCRKMHFSPQKSK